MAGENKSGSETKYKVIIFILLTICGVLTWQLLIKTGDWQTLQVEKSSLETDREALKGELENMLLNYDSLNATNVGMEVELEEQKQKIREMIQEIDHHKDDAYIIMKLRKESESLRTIMKGFVHTIDSLNTLNINLENENRHIKTKMDEVRDANRGLQEQHEDLRNIIDFGSILQTHALGATGLREKATGKVLETLRASRADILKTCFTIEENRITKAGEKVAYVRIIGPNGTVLQNSESVDKSILAKNGEKLSYSGERNFNYQNETVRMCIFFKKEKELQAGEYVSEIYVDGAIIGKIAFTMTD